MSEFVASPIFKVLILMVLLHIAFQLTFIADDLQDKNRIYDKDSPESLELSKKYNRRVYAELFLFSMIGMYLKFFTK